MDQGLDRRHFLSGLGALLAGTFGSPALAQVRCANACRALISADDRWAIGLPVIDAHCHIFNARDIPAVEFITDVFLPHYAPRMRPANRRRLAADIGEHAARVLGRTPGYEQEKTILEARLAGSSEYEAVRQASPSIPAFSHGNARSCFGSDVADNILAFRNLVRILRSFRHKNFETLLASNATGVEGFGVALYTPSMIDMDYWLGFGGAGASEVPDVGSGTFALNETPPHQQVELMEMIQRLHPGKCHGFVSYCPWRQLDDTWHNAEVGPESPRRRITALETVQDAILSRGFLGVKLYPPMGYYPLGNASLPVDAFPDNAAREPYAHEFGRLLDEALLSLYHFCAEHDVPVMAHCAHSNGAGTFRLGEDRIEPYERRAHPAGWGRVLARPGLENLRINLAHFGFANDPGTVDTWRQAIGTLMDTYPHVYTDLSHYPDVLIDDYEGTGQRCPEGSAFFENMRKSFFAGDQGGKRTWRMLYGSDWSMLSKEFYYGDYLSVMAKMYRRKVHSVGAGGKDNARNFLSSNAIRFMGLRAGEKSRKRLEAWYSRYGLDSGPLARFDGVPG